MEMDTIKCVAGPRIYLISRPVLNDEAIKSFLSDERAKWRRSTGASAAEEIVELGGRVCYMSFGEAQSRRRNDEYIRNLIEMGHESVLEHATWTFVLSGVSRSFSHQFVRHRVGFAFSQLSQQYHDETEASFVVPDALLGHQRAEEVWRASLQQARRAYAVVLEEIQAPTKPSTREQRRALRSAARSVLPNATETKIVVTANARAIRHFLNVRGNIAGDPEMRKVSALLLQVMKSEAPALFEDFELTILEDGSPSVVLTNRCERRREVENSEFKTTGQLTPPRE
jgi:thymidylate synthase (FAD)